MVTATTSTSVMPDVEPAASAISTKGLTKQFGSIHAVRDLSINIPVGKIVGFIGPNGSGKTTTIRMLLGLVRPTSGTAEVLGKSIVNPAGYLPRVGALIETPAFYPSMSGKANLQVLCSLGGIGGQRIPQIIETVGLTGRDGDKVGNYSLGMKQRLGVAAALLPDPQLLVLDEPANGLDPEGIIEMRELLRRFRQAGKTVFVSSHLLGELEQIADWLVVIKEGQAVYSGPSAELKGKQAASILLATSRPEEMEALVRVVAELGYPSSVEDGRLRVTAPPEAAGDINREATKAGVTLTEIQRSQATLEETFLAMITGRKQ